MSIKYYVERWTLRGWVRTTEGLNSLQVAENMKETLSRRHHEDIENFSIVVVGM